jgi:hypothetical protein
MGSFTALVALGLLVGALTGRVKVHSCCDAADLASDRQDGVTSASRPDLTREMPTWW